MILEKGSRLLMIGDSITDCGRDYQATPSSPGSMGEGYVSLVNSFLTGLMPESRISVVNQGIGGNTVVDLKERWEQDVISQSPDYLSVMIGVNDVWRHFDTVLQPTRKVDAQTYEAVYDDLIKQTMSRTAVKKIFILSPFMIVENHDFPMRIAVEQYAAIAKKIALQNDLVYVDVQAKMDQFLHSMPCYMISADHVHPNLAGHSIIAKAFLDAIGFEWSKA